jgi:hypothetical protein
MKRNQVMAGPTGTFSGRYGPSDLMEQTTMVNELDRPGKTVGMAVIQINNANPAKLPSAAGHGGSVPAALSTLTDPLTSRIQQNQTTITTVPSAPASVAAIIAAAANRVRLRRRLLIRTIF